MRTADQVAESHEIMSCFLRAGGSSRGVGTNEKRTSEF
jgi:hypothetical protein